MVCLGARMNDDVVDVDSAELVKLLEKEVHSPLECGGRVAEAKGHDAKLEGAVAGLEGGAFAVLGDDLDLVEPRSEVHFGEHGKPGMESRHSSIRGMGYTTFWVNALRRR